MGGNRVSYFRHLIRDGAGSEFNQASHRALREHLDDGRCSASWWVLFFEYFLFSFAGLKYFIYYYGIPFLFNVLAGWFRCLCTQSPAVAYNLKIDTGGCLMISSGNGKYLFSLERFRAVYHEAVY